MSVLYYVHPEQPAVLTVGDNAVGATSGDHNRRGRENRPECFDECIGNKACFASQRGVLGVNGVHVAYVSGAEPWFTAVKLRPGVPQVLATGTVL